jgi:hypothetical protein
MRFKLILVLAALALAPGLALARQATQDGDPMGSRMGEKMSKPMRQMVRKGAAEGDPMGQSLRQAGIFATHCSYTHRGPNDPIVHPGRIGASHSHDFFGNTTTDATSTFESLRVGGSSCLTPEDTSAYWVPTLLQNGVEIRPSAVQVYYRAQGPLAETVQPFPSGFKIVAGDARATTPQSMDVAYWSCRGDDVGDQSATPPTCAGESLKLQIRFPECWDGVNIDSPDHQSHMAYGRRTGCPESHPQMMPRVAINVIYPITGDPGVITLASGSVYSAHADFFNAWDPDTLADLVSRCLQAHVECGTIGRPMRGQRT